MTSAESTPSARDLQLDKFELQVAADIHALFDAVGPDGDPLYDELDVRDLIVACAFQHGMPVTAELQGLINEFIVDEIEIEDPDPNLDDLLEAVHEYFEEFPLNPRLASAFQMLGTESMRRSGEGFKGDSTRVSRTLASAGVRPSKRAPRAAELTPRRPGPRPKRGLS